MDEIKKRVFLCIPNHRFRLEEHGAFSTEHLGIAYLAAELFDQGFQVEILDAYILNLSSNQLCDLLGQQIASDETICFTTTFETAGYAKEVCIGLRSNGFKGEIIIGGWGVAMSPYEAAQYFNTADLIWTGWSAVEFVAMLSDGLQNPEKAGPIITGSHKNKMPDPPRISWGKPYHYVFEDARYIKHRHLPLPILQSIGCYWGQCTFCCTASRWSNNTCKRDIKSVIEEITESHDAYGVKQFSFVDDCFLDGTLEGNGRSIFFAREISRISKHLKFSIDCRVSDVEKTLFQELRSNGLCSVFLGIETGSPASLKRFNKGHSAKQCINAISILRQLKINIILGYISFEPFMSLNDAFDAIQFLHKYFPEEFKQRCTDKLIPYPSTCLFDMLNQRKNLVGKYPAYSFRFLSNDVDEMYSTFL